MTFWLTRPQADSEALAAQLSAHGIQTLIAPLLTIKPCTVSLPKETPAALLLTSRHAAHALPTAWSHLPVYCVGEATAKAARARGYKNIIIGEGDVLALLPAIANALRGERLLYLSGEDISVDVEALLVAQNVEVTRIIAYHAAAEEGLPASVIEALKKNKITGTVFYSARTARIACGLMRAAECANAAKTIDAYCLSLNVAQEAGALPWAHLYVAHVPTVDAMQAMIVENAQRIDS